MHKYSILDCMKRRLSFRLWLSIATLLLIALILFLARSELVYAWGLLGKINLGKLVWMLPIIAAGYLATGEMIFSYLRQKGFVKNINPATLARISLELNLPSLLVTCSPKTVAGRHSRDRDRKSVV